MTVRMKAFEEELGTKLLVRGTKGSQKSPLRKRIITQETGGENSLFCTRNRTGNFINKRREWVLLEKNTTCFPMDWKIS